MDNKIRGLSNPSLIVPRKSETLGIPVGRDEMGYCYPVGDPEPGSGKSHLTKA